MTRTNVDLQAAEESDRRWPAKRRRSSRPTAESSKVMSACEKTDLGWNRRANAKYSMRRAEANRERLINIAVQQLYPYSPW